MYSMDSPGIYTTAATSLLLSFSTTPTYSHLLKRPRPVRISLGALSRSIPEVQRPRNSRLLTPNPASAFISVRSSSRYIRTISGKVTYKDDSDVKRSPLMNDESLQMEIEASGVEHENMDWDSGNLREIVPQRYRTVFSDSQIRNLTSVFKKTPQINAKKRMELAKDLDLNQDIIKTWFKNQRFKVMKRIRNSRKLANISRGFTGCKRRESHNY